MSDQNNNQTQNIISQSTVFTALSDEDKLTLVTELGDVVVQSSLVRLVAELNPEQVEALEQFLDGDPTTEVLLKHLLDHHARFSEFLEEEIKNIQAETADILGE